MTKKMRADGFSALGIIGAICVVIVVGLAGWYVFQNRDTRTKNNSSTTSKTSNAKPADSYAGWKTYCDTENTKGCFKYPNDWVASQYGGYENSTQTAYVNYSGYNNKDQASDTAYVAQISEVTNSSLNLKIVGSVYKNVPSYSIFNAADVATLKVGEDTTVVTVNPEFQRNPGEDMSFTATPGASGIKAITTLDQAKAWFSTPEAQNCLKVLQSFYYQ